MGDVGELPADLMDLLEPARAFGFGGFVYGVDAADGETDAPEVLRSAGFRPGHLSAYMQRYREDPLRRLVARGEIAVGTVPVVFENLGDGLSVARDRRMSAGDQAFLRWMLGSGMRLGVSFRIRLGPGRFASLNFYSPHPLRPEAVEMAMGPLFLCGHRAHARLEPHLPRPGGRLLSHREAQCLEWIALGKSNREIALLLGLSLDTVKEHVQSLFQKLRVSGRAQAVSKGHALAYLS